MSFPPYASYKDSGVQWLGEVPTGWAVEPLKRIAAVIPSNVDKKTVEGERPVQLCNYTDVYYNDLITGEITFMEASASAEQIGRFGLRAGDVILTKDSETADDIAISAYVPADLPGVVCGYHLALVRSDPSVADGAFLKRYFDTAFAKASVAVRANGLTRVGLGQYALDNLQIPTPSVAEQRAIADFLDRETAKIDALVEAQRRLIALLKEKRQAVISHAVTKGLDPSAPLKPSRIPWLGDVPAHWEVKPLMRLTAPGRDIMYGIVLPGPDVGEGVPIVKGGDVKGRRLARSSLCWTTPEIEAPFARARLREGDLVYSIRGSIGDAEPIPAELNEANITQDVARISPDYSRVDGRWLLHVMRSKPVFVQLEQGSLGAAVRGINIFDLKRARIPIPPRDEQMAIAKWLDREIEQFEQLIGEASSSLNILTERRAAQISAAVTGKIDVRGWTAEQVRNAVGAEIVHLHAGDRTFGRVQNQKLLFLAQTHASVSEIGGRFQRKAAGPHDADLMTSIEKALTAEGVLQVSQPGGAGSQVTYNVTRGTRPDRSRLQAMLGDERLAKLDHLLKVLADEDTRGVEAVATIYGVWNDALLDGEAPDDERLVRGFMAWHPEKAAKFTTADVRNRIGFMRRNGLVPEGRGSRTQVGALL